MRARAVLAEYRVRVLAPPGFQPNEVMDAALAAVAEILGRRNVSWLQDELRLRFFSGRVAALNGFDVVVEPVEDR